MPLFVQKWKWSLWSSNTKHVNMCHVTHVCSISYQPLSAQCLPDGWACACGRQFFLWPSLTHPAGPWHHPNTVGNATLPPPPGGDKQKIWAMLNYHKSVESLPNCIVKVCEVFIPYQNIVKLHLNDIHLILGFILGLSSLIKCFKSSCVIHSFCRDGFNLFQLITALEVLVMCFF